MEVRDAIRVAGQTALELFPWGRAVVNIANEFLPDGFKLNSRSNGDDLYHAIQQLPPEAQVAVLSKQIDYAIAESNNEKEKAIAREQADVTGKTARPTVVLMLTGMVVAVTLLIAIAYTTVARQTGSLPDSGLLEAILTLTGEILKSYFGAGG